MPKLDLQKIQARIGSTYPAPFDEPCKTRTGLGLSDASGLTQFGAHLVILALGVLSAIITVMKMKSSILFLVIQRFLRAAIRFPYRLVMSRPIRWETGLGIT